MTTHEYVCIETREMTTLTISMPILLRYEIINISSYNLVRQFLCCCTFDCYAFVYLFAWIARVEEMVYTSCEFYICIFLMPVHYSYGYCRTIFSILNTFKILIFL